MLPAGSSSKDGTIEPERLINRPADPAGRAIGCQRTEGRTGVVLTKQHSGLGSIWKRLVFLELSQDHGRGCFGTRQGAG